ncbi:MAG: restriction endonuclease [Nitrospiraceae bacterium]|nr:restriction endonuclease [Nitrospiraceae bacterium]
MNDWKKYQEDTAAYFRSLGLDASTNVTVKGVRTCHDIDVYVKSHYVGFDIVWIVECKYWKTAVSKLHVLALREIVADIGADRGILLSESGFQSGAVEAANLTNVQVTSIAEMRHAAENSINAMRLRELFDRAGVCKDRYWEIPKEERIKAGLRPDVGGYDFSGDIVIKLCTDLLTRAFRGKYPFQSDTLESIVHLGRDKQFESAGDVISFVDEKMTELEAKLDNYEHTL